MLRPQASTFTQRLLPAGSRAWAVRDKELRDRFGRYLLYLWTEDGEFANEELARTGHAPVVLFEPNDRYI